MIRKIVFTGGTPIHDGYKSKDSFQNVLSNIQNPDRKYAPYVFWFFDQDLNTLGIKPQEMAHELSKKGFNPGYAHARPNYARAFGNLVNEHVQPLPSEQWLSKVWTQFV